MEDTNKYGPYLYVKLRTVNRDSDRSLLEVRTSHGVPFSDNGVVFIGPNDSVVFRDMGAHLLGTLKADYEPKMWGQEGLVLTSDQLWCLISALEATKERRELRGICTNELYGLVDAVKLHMARVFTFGR